MFNEHCMNSACVIPHHLLTVLPLIGHMDYCVYFHVPIPYKNNFSHVHIINFSLLQENGCLLGFHTMQ